VARFTGGKKDGARELALRSSTPTLRSSDHVAHTQAMSVWQGETMTASFSRRRRIGEMVGFSFLPLLRLNVIQRAIVPLSSLVSLSLSFSPPSRRLLSPWSYRQGLALSAEGAGVGSSLSPMGGCWCMLRPLPRVPSGSLRGNPRKCGRAA
jgi:hypothetical protein